MTYTAVQDGDLATPAYMNARFSELLNAAAINVKDSAYGATGDGTTDDTAAIQAALDAASAAGGGRVMLPPGTYLVSSMLTVPHKVQLRGHAGWDGVKILADSSFDFSTNTAVISIGEPDVLAFGSVVSDLMVDCATVANSIGIYIASGNEASGCERVHVTKCMKYGIQVDASNSAVPQNYFLRDVSVGISATATSSDVRGILISGGSADHRGLDGVTIDVSPSGALGTGSVGVSLNGMGGLVSRIHAEDVETGIDIGPVQACTGLHIAGVTGASTVSHLVRLNSASNSQNVMLTGLRKNSGVNVITDQLNGITKTSSDVGMYAIGDGSPQPVMQLTSLQGPYTFGGRLTLEASMAFSTTTSSNTAGQLWKSESNGLAMRGITGSTYDWAVLDAASTQVVLGNLSGTTTIAISGPVQMSGELNHDGSRVGFYGSAPVTQQSVTVSTQSIHDALVNLGLITT